MAGLKGSYSYLPGSVDRFPAPDESMEWMRKAGFARVSPRELSRGIAVLYAGKNRLAQKQR